MDSIRNEVSISKQLKEYGSFLLNSRIDEYAKESIRLSYEVDLPLLRLFSHLSREQVLNVSKPNQLEFLSALAQGRVHDHISLSVGRWLSDQIPLIGKYDVQARDLTLAVYIRTKTLKHFLQDFTSDINQQILLGNEIDAVMLAYSTAFTDAYINLLKERVNEEASFSSTIINASPGITFIYDLVADKETFITGRVTDVTGFTPEEVLSMPNLASQITHPDDIHIVEDLLKRTISDVNGSTYTADYRIKNKAGDFLWMRCYAVVYKKSPEGRPIQTLGVAYDVTQEKATSMELAKRESQLLEAQAIGRIGSFDWDIVNDSSVSTPEVRKIFEADHRQTLDEMLSHVDENDKEKVKEALAEAFKTGTYRCEYRYRTKSGLKIIDTRGIVSYAQEGTPKTLTGTIQDITDRKQIENELVAKTNELERSNERLEQFAYVASHDLKEPLRKIAMFSDLIVTSDWDNLSDRTKANVQKITVAASRMQQLIEGLLSYSYLNVQSPPEMYSLQRCLQQALDNLEFAIAEPKAVVTSDALPDAVVVPYQIEQLFQNLISNSLKFSKKGIPPEITLTHTIVSAGKMRSKAAPDVSKYLQITIHDNGIGFNKKSGERIFGLFQRLHSKSEYEGSGLGLAICQKIVENHKGYIEATGEEGKGATFIISLPIRREA